MTQSKKALQSAMVRRLKEHSKTHPGFARNAIEKKENGCWHWKHVEFLRIGGCLVRPIGFAFYVYNNTYPVRSRFTTTCGDKKCINPEHLQPLSASFNIRGEEKVLKIIRDGGDLREAAVAVKKSHEWLRVNLMRKYGKDYLAVIRA